MVGQSTTREKSRLSGGRAQRPGGGRPGCETAPLDASKGWPYGRHPGELCSLARRRLRPEPIGRSAAAGRPE
eukprot:607089-Alexandrium_andersonii.AAC.1